MFLNIYILNTVIFSLFVTKKQMNVNENLLQLALKESQDTNMFKLSFDSNII